MSTETTTTETTTTETTTTDSTTVIDENEGEKTSEDSSSSGAVDVLPNLSDKDIVMNFLSIDELCSGWNTKVAALELTADRVVQGLNILTSYGINESYATSLATAVGSLTATIAEVTATIKNASDGQQTVDNTYLGGGSGFGDFYGSGGGNHSDASSGTEVNNNQEKDEITVADVTKIATIDDYIGLSVLLSSIVSEKDTSLDKVLDHFDATLIKKQILTSANLSDELKKVLCELDPETLKTVLSNFYKNGSIHKLDQLGIEYLNNYIEKVAIRNNMTATELVTNASNKDLLYNEVENYEKAVQLLDDQDKIEIVQKIYDGNEVSGVKSGLLSAVRDVVDMIADKNQTTAEKLLMNPSELNQVSGFQPFLSILKSSDNLQSVLKGLYTKRGNYNG